MMSLVGVYRRCRLNCVTKSQTILSRRNFSGVSVATAAASGRRRFYKRVSVVAATEPQSAHAALSPEVAQNGTEPRPLTDCDQYEICLDHRRLRTPAGSVMRVPGHALALVVAHEWDSAGDRSLATSQMHVTGLCATVLDNPARLTPSQLANKMAEHLNGDTILYPVEEPAALAQRQREAWTPVVDWFSRRFSVPLAPSRADCLTACAAPEAGSALQRHLAEHGNMWSLTGLLFAAEALRSPLLALFALEQRVLPADVALLSRLEAEYQSQLWGRVQWGHDVDALDTEARAAAGLLLARLCSSHVHSTVVHKQL